MGHFQRFEYIDGWLLFKVFDKRETCRKGMVVLTIGIQDTEGVTRRGQRQVVSFEGVFQFGMNLD